MFVTVAPGVLRRYFRGVDPSPEARLTRDTAGRIWAYMQEDRRGHLADEHPVGGLLTGRGGLIKLPAELPGGQAV